MKNFLVALIIAMLLICNIGFAKDLPARDLVASLAEIPGLIDSPDKGAFVDVVKAMDDVYPGKIKIEVYPFARSIDNVLSGKADFHIPCLRNPDISESTLPYALVSEKLGSLAFVIYSNIDKKITRKNIDNALAKGSKFPYYIEGSSGLASNMPFPLQPTNDLEQSLRKVQAKRIEALVQAQEETDMLLKNLKMSKIYRSLYGNFDDVILIQKGSAGDEINKILSECLLKLKASGRMQQLYKKVHLPYNDWQPANMGW